MFVARKTFSEQAKRKRTNRNNIQTFRQKIVFFVFLYTVNVFMVYRVF